MASDLVRGTRWRDRFGGLCELIGEFPWVHPDFRFALRAIDEATGQPVTVGPGFHVDRSWFEKANKVLDSQTSGV